MGLEQHKMKNKFWADIYCVIHQLLSPPTLTTISSTATRDGRAIDGVRILSDKPYFVK